MRKASLPRKLNEIDERLVRLREQIRKKTNPIAIGNALASFHLDNIVQLQACRQQLHGAVDCNCFGPGITSEEDFARVFAILRIWRRLDSLLLTQFDHFLNCFGGSRAIAVQQIVRWASEDLVHREWLVAFATNKRSRQRS